MIVHYLASNPNFIPFFLMGFTIALGFSFWGNAKQGCLIGALYVYVFGAWLLTCLIFVLGQSSGQEFFIFGILAYHIKTVFSWISTAFFWILEKNREWKQAEERAKWEKEQAQRYQHQHQQHDRAEQVRREQERREREARQYREQQERARREQEQAQQKSQQQHQRQEKQQEPPPKKPEPARDTRTFEEILGLSSAWTQDDLRTAYKRESQRLHPDKWTGKPANIQAIMEAEFKAVQQAYNRLKK